MIYRYCKWIAIGIAVVGAVVCLIAGFFAGLNGLGEFSFAPESRGISGRCVDPHMFSHSVDQFCGLVLFVIFAILLLMGICGAVREIFQSVKEHAKSVNNEIEKKENLRLFAAQEKGQLSLPFDGECSLSLVDGEGTLSLVESQGIAH